MVHPARNRTVGGRGMRRITVSWRTPDGGVRRDVVTSRRQVDHLIRDRSTAGCKEFRTGKEERE